MDAATRNRISLHSGYFQETLRSWQATGTNIDASMLIYPLFISSTNTAMEEISSLPGQYRIGIDNLINHVTQFVNNGLKTVLLFGVMKDDAKDAVASKFSLEMENKVIPAIKLLKEAFPSLLVACDLCLCTFTSHGHCGILNSDGSIDNEKTIHMLAELGLVYAKAGCDILAPSDMMDGRVDCIANILKQNGLRNKVSIMSYSAKFASCFYGPFRDAAGSAPSFGDRKSYQLPPGAKGLAMRAVERDIQEGADILMVKPGMPYLDLLQQIKTKHPEYPLAVYQVSGEYAMIYHASEHGSLDLERGIFEVLTSMRRAGADVIITYFTPLILQFLQKSRK